MIKEVPDPVALGRYLAILAAIPAVCGALGALIFGINIANVGVHMSLASVILGALAGYVLWLAAVYGLGLVLGWLAPAFGGVNDRGAGIQVAVYGVTASCVGGFANLYPGLGLPVGVLAGLYSLHAIYLGLGRVMRVPDGRRLTAFAVALAAILALGAVRGVLTARAAELGGPLSASYTPPR